MTQLAMNGVAQDGITKFEIVTLGFDGSLSHTGNIVHNYSISQTSLL